MSVDQLKQNKWGDGPTKGLFVTPKNKMGFKRSTLNPAIMNLGTYQKLKRSQKYTTIIYIQITLTCLPLKDSAPEALVLPNIQKDKNRI